MSVSLRNYYQLIYESDCYKKKTKQRQSIVEVPDISISFLFRTLLKTAIDIKGVLNITQIDLFEKAHKKLQL